MAHELQVPVLAITKWGSLLIAFGTLLSDLWFSEKWPLPEFLNHQSRIQVLFGLIFLLIIAIWINCAFLKPSIYGKRNYTKYANYVYTTILKGSESELSILAHELAASAESIVHYATKLEKYEKEESVNSYANDIILLIANRKLCRFIISSSPITAIAFFEEMAKNVNYRYPASQFSKNINQEALKNRDSNLYHEDEGYISGLLGYHKPFTTAIYGNFQLVENLTERNGSPFYIDYGILTDFTNLEFTGYTRAALVFTKAYIFYMADKRRLINSNSFTMITENIEHFCSKTYMLNELPKANYKSDEAQKLSTAVNFIRHVITELDKTKAPLPTIKKRIKRNYESSNIYDNIAGLMYEIILLASGVNSNTSLCWSIHFSTVWSNFFRPVDGDDIRHKLILFKLRRLLYNEILELNNLPNYVGVRILGYCLNVMGLSPKPTNTLLREFEKPLHKVVINWTKANFLDMYDRYPDVAESAMIGKLTFEPENLRIVKTFEKGLERVPPKTYLELDPIKK